MSLFRLRYLTTGESHGPALHAVLEGLPASVTISKQKIDFELARRQKGYGRGGRMKIEKDEVEVLSGLRHGYTLGSPLTLRVINKDYHVWQNEMNPYDTEAEVKRAVTRPRPGHADLSGGIKFGFRDLRNVLERASARETTMRVAVGSVCKQFLQNFGIVIAGHVTAVADAVVPEANWTAQEILDTTEDRPLRCMDEAIEQKMIAKIDEAKKNGDSLGGIFEIRVDGLPIGLGSYAQWDRKLDGRIAQAMMSIQAVKGVEIGAGFANALKFGSEVHDALYYAAEQQKFYRPTNRAGGLKGSMTNGEQLLVRGALKPISTLYTPLHSVDIDSKESFEASIERSDTCAVAAAAVIGEAVLAITLADAMLEKFGGDSLPETLSNFKAYQQSVVNY